MLAGDYFIPHALKVRLTIYFHMKLDITTYLVDILSVKLVKSSPRSLHILHFHFARLNCVLTHLIHLTEQIKGPHSK